MIPLTIIETSSRLYHCQQDSQALQINGVSAERVAKVGREMQKKLDVQSVTSTMKVKFKVQALSSHTEIPKLNENKDLPELT